jgi:O-antigen/teichoic acid export membrane protein
MLSKLKIYRSALRNIKIEELLIHSKNYIGSELISKGIAFIILLLVTKAVIPSEYGIISIFISLLTFFSLLFELGIRGGILRYYYENKDEFTSFLGTNTIFLFSFVIILMILIYFLRDIISKSFHLSPFILLSSAISSSLCIPAGIMLSYFQASKNSSKYGILLLAKNSFPYITGFIAIYLLRGNKVNIWIYSVLIVNIIMAISLLPYLGNIIKLRFKKSYLVYFLAFSIPLLPHMFSGYILGAFDQIIINQLSSEIEAGKYAIVFQLGIIMSVIILGMNNAWVPMFYEKLNQDKFVELFPVLNKYICIITTIGIFLVLFLNNIAKLFISYTFYEALTLTPILVLGYFFIFIFTLYSNFAFYYKKTLFISIISIISAFVSIGLKYLFIPIFSYKFAAYATCISYFILFILHFLNVKYILKDKNIINLKYIIPSTSVLLFATIYETILSHFKVSMPISFIMNIIIFSLSVLFLQKYYIKKTLVNLCLVKV